MYNKNMNKGKRCTIKDMYKHRYQTIKWLFKNIFWYRGFSVQRKREQAFPK